MGGTYPRVDPPDIGRSYDSSIPIYSQSGESGVAYVMDQDFGFKMLKVMHPEFGRIIQGGAEKEGRELKHDKMFQAFEQNNIWRQNHPMSDKPLM